MNKLIFIIILASVYGCRNECGNKPVFRRFSSDKWEFKDCPDWAEDSTKTLGKLIYLRHVEKLSNESNSN
jgi:hypothetical protein